MGWCSSGAHPQPAVGEVPDMNSVHRQTIWAFRPHPDTTKWRSRWAGWLFDQRASRWGSRATSSGGPAGAAAGASTTVRRCSGQLNACEAANEAILVGELGSYSTHEVTRRMAATPEGRGTFARTAWSHWRRIVWALEITASPTARATRHGPRKDLHPTLPPVAAATVGRGADRCKWPKGRGRRPNRRSPRGVRQRPSGHAARLGSRVARAAVLGRKADDESATTQCHRHRTVADVLGSPRGKALGIDRATLAS